MPFSGNHRTICEVLEEIRSQAAQGSDVSALVDEAKDYAQRMSAKLVEYKDRLNGKT